MKALKLAAAAALACMLAAACEKKNEVLVTEIEMSETDMELYVGETKPLTVTCKPGNATNIGQLKVESSNENLVTFRDGVVTAIASGAASVRASCGNAFNSCRVRVYDGAFYKNGGKFRIDVVSGYIYYKSEPEPQSLDFVFTQNGAGPYESENLRVYIDCDGLGKDLDFTKAVEPYAFVCAYTNNNENGYDVYASPEGEPSVRKSDWSPCDGVTLTKGELRVDNVSPGRYKIHVDFMLSDGYDFSVDWEGTASLKVEGKI